MEEPTDRITEVKETLEALITNLYQSNKAFVDLIEDILRLLGESSDSRFLAVTRRLEEIRRTLCLRPPGCGRGDP